jgi:GntR family transcriptional regulator, rspAB operon transcriptional repressor
MSVDSGVVSVRQQITDRLRNEILSGRIAEGERLKESTLADRFGVSRGPIREVLAHLSQEGLLLIRANYGAQVAPSAPACIHELIVPVRRMMETYALKLVVAALNDDDFAQWEEILHRMERACQQKDLAGITEQDLAFHAYILKRTGMPDLLAIWRPVVARIRSHLRQAIVKIYDQDLTGIVEVHRELLNVFRSGDPRKAVAALEKHVQ